jgi:hypothetical protein
MGIRRRAVETVQAAEIDAVLSAATSVLHYTHIRQPSSYAWT